MSQGPIDVADDGQGLSLVSIIREVKGDSSGRRVSSEKVSVPSGKGVKGKGRTKRVVPVYSDKPAKEGEKCPICGKGIVRKGMYGLFCSEYKTTGCRLKNK